MTLLRHSGPALTGEQREQLDAHGITVTEGPVEEIEAGPEGLTGVRLAGGRQLKLDAVVVAPRMHARAELLAPLGLEPAELRHGDYLIGTYIEADPVGATAIPGVWVAGNLANLQAQVMTAAAAGLAAGAAINYDLILEETAQAAAARQTKGKVA
ncbi:MAG TPA: FAD-dependent oxidoreductase [Streptosporangiaceae bacterium]|nr:FAD-dependent oxidoreductase [Streptosporangiaceae bacterium]